MVLHPDRNPVAAALASQRLIERVVGLDEAAALLPGFDRASPAGMTMIDPLHGWIHGGRDRGGGRGVGICTSCRVMMAKCDLITCPMR